MAKSVSVDEQRVVVREWLGVGSLNVFGIQFAGKDTQCLRLAHWTDGVVLGAGDIYRNKTQLSAHAQEVTDAGHPIPMDEFFSMIVPFLAKAEYRKRPLLLTAFGRRDGEQQGVVRALVEAGHPLRAVVLLEINEDEVWRRWGFMHEKKDREHRADDSEAGLRTRLHEFRDKTLPVLDFYRGLGLLFAVDSSKPTAEVELAILQGLYERATQAL